MGKHLSLARLTEKQRKQRKQRHKRAYIKLLNRLRNPKGLYNVEDIWIVSVIGDALGFSPEHVEILGKAAEAQIR